MPEIAHVPGGKTCFWVFTWQTKQKVVSVVNIANQLYHLYGLTNTC